MLRAFVEKILEMAPVEIKYFGTRTYTDAPLLPVLEPAPAPIAVHTLTAIKDYLTDNPDGLNRGTLFLHVESESKIVLGSSLIPPFLQRFTYMIASFSNRFRSGDYIPVENFIIDLNTMFLASPTTAEIIKLVGNLTDGKATQYNDDGISQQVATKVGITRVENVPVPSPVVLTPYRTFSEVDQPQSIFLFRIKSSANGPLCALIPADGDYWKNSAISSIKAWLRASVPAEVKILA